MTNNNKNSYLPSNELMQSIIDATDDLIFVKNTDFVYLAGNAAFEKFIGRPLDKIIGHTDDDWFPDQETVDYFRDWDRKLFATGETQNVEEWVDYPDGSRILLHTIKYPIYKDDEIIGLVGLSRDITAQHRAETFNQKTAKIIEMVSLGKPTEEIYNAITTLYESRHKGMRCSLLTLLDGRLQHGSAPSLPKAYCEAVHDMQNGPDIGSCGTSTYTGKRCLVENIETDPRWADLKAATLPHGMRCCWSEPIKSASGDVLGAFGMYYDHPALPNTEELADLESAARLAGIVIERDRDQKKIKELAYFDYLTNVASRAHLCLFIEDLIKTHARSKRPFSLLYIDLDDFKNINDTLGHDAGDLLLKEIALRLKKASRETDLVARIGGDEFCVVVVESESHTDVTNIVERYFEEIRTPLLIQNREYMPSCSIGISSFPTDGTTLSELLKAADTALYNAKDSGKNRYAYYQCEGS